MIIKALIFGVIVYGIYAWIQRNPDDKPSVPPVAGPPLVAPSPPATVELEVQKRRIHEMIMELEGAERRLARLEAELFREVRREIRSDVELQLNLLSIARLDEEAERARSSVRDLRVSLSAGKKVLGRELARLGLPSDPLAAELPIIPELGSSAAPTSEQAREAAAIEASLNLTDGDRRRVQQALTNDGLDTRGIDGILGPRSREMIVTWQKKRGEPATGYLNSAQASALLK